MDHRGGLDDLRPSRAFHRIEVEVQIVGSIDIVAASVPGIEIDAAKIDHPQKRRQVADDREIDDVAGRMLDVASVYPSGTRRRRAFHKEKRPGNAVGVTFHDHGAID